MALRWYTVVVDPRDVASRGGWTWPGQDDREVTWTVPADPEDNEFCVLSSCKQ